jgi:hypothetical protein
MTTSSGLLILSRLLLIVFPVIVVLRAAAQPLLSDCTVSQTQLLAPTGMTIAPITNANLDLGPQPTGALAVPSNGPLPGFCQLTGTMVTNKMTGKTANFAVLLPENWNGKTLFAGCGGLCGFVFESGIPFGALVKGYAVVATDDGHQSTRSVFEAGWALNSKGAPDHDALRTFTIVPFTLSLSLARSSSKTGTPTRSSTRTFRVVRAADARRSSRR